jgi:hypothetical protein
MLGILTTEELGVFQMYGRGRSLYSSFVMQAAITAVFAVLIDARVISHAVLAAEVIAAALCLGVGLVIRSRQTQATWLLAMGFEILFVVAGIALFAVGHVYMVGTIIAIGTIMRLSQFRAQFSGAQMRGPGGYPGVTGYGQPTGPVVQGAVDPSPED